MATKTKKATPVKRKRSRTVKKIDSIDPAEAITINKPVTEKAHVKKQKFDHTDEFKTCYHHHFNVDGKDQIQIEMKPHTVAKYERQSIKGRDVLVRIQD